MLVSKTLKAIFLLSSLCDIFFLSLVFFNVSLNEVLIFIGYAGSEVDYISDISFMSFAIYFLIISIVSYVLNSLGQNDQLKIDFSIVEFRIPKSSYLGMLFVLVYFLSTTIPKLSLKTVYIDEAFTFNYLVQRGTLVSLLYYPGPNNHIFFSFLCSILNHIFTPLVSMKIVPLVASLFSLLICYRMFTDKILISFIFINIHIKVGDMP